MVPLLVVTAAMTACSFALRSKEDIASGIVIAPIKDREDERSHEMSMRDLD